MSLVDPSAAEERKEQMYRRLGDRNAVCVICGEDDPRCLQLHHVAGRRFADDVLPVCGNCHAKLSDGQRDHPVSIDGFDTEVLKQVRMKLGQAQMLRALADQLDAEAANLFTQEINQIGGNSNGP